MFGTFIYKCLYTVWKTRKLKIYLLAENENCNLSAELRKWKIETVQRESFKSNTAMGCRNERKITIKQYRLGI